MIQAARTGNTNGPDAVIDTARYLGLGLANIVTLLNPQLIVLGGGLLGAARLALEEFIAFDTRRRRMSATKYYEKITQVLEKIHETQNGAIEQATEAMAQAIAAGKRVYLFGSGHSVIPVMDVFPRYGSFVGFFPRYDPRLMWSNVVGPGGAREVLCLERKECYVEVFLQSYPLDEGDVLNGFSHGGLNAAPIEAATYAKARAEGDYGILPCKRKSCQGDAFFGEKAFRRRGCCDR